MDALRPDILQQKIRGAIEEEYIEAGELDGLYELKEKVTSILST